MWTLLLSLIKWIPGLSLLPALGDFLSKALDIVSPILKGIAEGLVWYVKTLWEGFKDVIDNAATVIFVISLCVGIGTYVHHKDTQRHKVEIQKVIKAERAKIAKANKKPVAKSKTPFFDEIFGGLFR